MRPPANFQAITESQYPLPSPTTVTGVRQAIIEQVRWLPDVVVGCAAGAATSFVNFDFPVVQSEAKRLDRHPGLEEIIAANGLLLNCHRFDVRQLGEQAAGERLRVKTAGRHFILKYNTLLHNGNLAIGGTGSNVALHLHRIYEKRVLGLTGPVDVSQEGRELTERMVRHALDFAAIDR